MHEYLNDLTAAHYAAALAAAFLIGLSKTGIAGAGILSVPLIAGVFPAARSSGLMLPILVVGDVFAVAWYRKSAQWRYVARTLPWAAAGIVVGHQFMKFCTGDDAAYPVSETALRRGIGLGILAMLALGWWIKRPAPAPAVLLDPDSPDGVPASESVRLRLAKAVEAERGASPGGAWLAPLIGLTAGFTTMVANAAGPVWVVYMLLLGLPKKEFLGTTGWAFLIINLFKVPFSAHLGFIAAPTLWLNGKMLPGLAAGSALGIWVVPRISQSWFNRVASALAVLAALNLVFGPELAALWNAARGQ